MAAGLVNFDEARGWRGAGNKLDITGDWGFKLADVKSLSDISPWRLAVVLETSDQSARIGFQPGRALGGAVAKERQTGTIPLDAVRVDNGSAPATVLVDAPIEIDQGQGAGVWRPDNFSVGRYRGPTTLREALKWSLNPVTVRLAQDIGMPLIGEYAKRFGVYDELPNYLSYALGAGETTVMRMVTAYSMFANGGPRGKSTPTHRLSTPSHPPPLHSPPPHNPPA